MAGEACDAVMSFIKMSQLDFLIQETPYSSFITLRKKFRKEFTNRAGAEVTKKNTADIIEGLKQENETLKDILEVKEVQLKAAREESTLLLKKLEKAEKEMFNHCEANAKLNKKSAEETAKLKAALKEKSDTIAAQMVDESDTRKTIKTLEKSIHNSENKIQNLEEKIESMKTSKSEFKKERDRLFNEVKNLKKNTKKPQDLMSSASQTEAEIPEVCSNNNPNPNRSSAVVSSASQTISSTASSSSQTYPSPDMSSSDITQLSCQADSLYCVVCNKTFLTAHLLKMHAAKEHDLVLSPLKLLDYDEKDYFVRFLRSMELDENYIEDRKKFYPLHWDNLGERVKFRKLAQIKLGITSMQIEDNMRKNDVNNTRAYGWSFSNKEI